MSVVVAEKKALGRGRQILPHLKSSAVAVFLPHGLKGNGTMHGIVLCNGTSHS